MTWPSPYYGYPCYPNYFYCYTKPYLTPKVTGQGLRSAKSMCNARQELEESMCAHVEACQDFLCGGMNLRCKGRSFNEDYRGFSGDYGSMIGSTRSLMQSMIRPDFSRVVNMLDDKSCWVNLDQDLDRELAPTNHMRPRDPPPPPPKCYWIPPQTLSCETISSQGRNRTRNM